MEVSTLIEAGVRLKASDIHLMEGSPPYLRIDGDLLPAKHPPVTHEELLGFLKEILPDRLTQRFEEARGVDLSYQYKDTVRCRLIVFFERQRIRVVFRLIPLNVPTLEELDLPPVIKKIAAFRRGMVLVTGPTGSGKSTTLASIIDYINSTSKISITTIEDPIEYLHQNKKSIVSQREIGDDVQHFSTGLVQALRQDPDVIMVGEVRDVETTRIAIRASETGHLLFSTLHTTNAVQTIERIVGSFPDSEHDLVREQMSNNLKAVLTQNLVKRATGKGRVAAMEILIVTEVVAKLVRDNRLSDIWGIIKSGQEGMQVFDQALANLVRENKIAEDQGSLYARDTHAYGRYVRGVQSSSDTGGIIGGFVA